jgi:hypothetical protein
VASPAGTCVGIAIGAIDVVLEDRGVQRLGPSRRGIRRDVSIVAE